MKERVVAFPDRSAIEAEAAAWLIKLDGDRPLTQQESGSLREWLARSPAHREELRNLAGHWDRLNVLTELAVPLGKSHIETGNRVVENGRKAMRFAWAGAAAVVVIGIAIGVGLWSRPDSDPFVAANGLYATTVGQQQSITLADGSAVLLNTNSQIKVEYGDQFRDIRLLQGEVHFSVARNADGPFRVFAGNERIEAVGTAFSVRLKGAAVSVAVTEGRVALVSLESLRNGMPSVRAAPDIDHSLRAPPAIEDTGAKVLGTLQAGQVATIKSDPGAAANRISTLQDVRTLPLQDMARRLSWRDGVLMFSGERLDEVVDEISRYTTVSIEISDPKVSAIRIGGRFPVGETEAMLAALETNFGIHVTRLNHDRVVLSAAIE